MAYGRRLGARAEAGLRRDRLRRVHRRRRRTRYPGRAMRGNGLPAISDRRALRIWRVGDGGWVPALGDEDAVRSDSISRRPAARELVRRSRTGIFCRWHDRATHCRPCDDRQTPRDFARLGHALQTDTEGSANNCAGIAGRCHRRQVRSSERATRCESSQNSISGVTGEVIWTQSFEVNCAMPRPCRMKWREPSPAKSISPRRRRSRRAWRAHGLSIQTSIGKCSWAATTPLKEERKG